MKNKESELLKNITQVRERKGFTKRKMAELLNINEASYGRMEAGEVAITYSRLAEIASIFQMPIIDLITYPDVYRKVEVDGETARADEPVEAVLQIKLRREKREQVLKLVFGDNDIEILNK